MMFNDTFNSISAISWQSGNRRKPPTCCNMLLL